MRLLGGLALWLRARVVMEEGPALESSHMGESFIARIEDILQKVVMIVSCDAMLTSDEPAYCSILSCQKPHDSNCLTAFCHPR